MRVLYSFYLNDSSVECSSKGFYSRENKLLVPVGNGKGEVMKTFLNKTTRYGENLDGNQLVIFEKNNNNFFFMDPQIHLHFHFWKLVKVFSSFSCPFKRCMNCSKDECLEQE